MRWGKTTRKTFPHQHSGGHTSSETLQCTLASAQSYLSAVSSGLDRSALGHHRQLLVDSILKVGNLHVALFVVHRLQHFFALAAAVLRKRALVEALVSLRRIPYNSSWPCCSTPQHHHHCVHGTKEASKRRINVNSSNVEPLPVSSTTCPASLSPSYRESSVAATEGGSETCCATLEPCNTALAQAEATCLAASLGFPITLQLVGIRAWRFAAG